MSGNGQVRVDNSALPGAQDEISADTSRLTDYGMALAIGGMMLSGMVSAKTVAFSVPVVAVLFIVHAWRVARFSGLSLPMPSAYLPWIALVALAGLSAAWSVEPIDAIGKSSFVAIMIALTGLAIATVDARLGERIWRAVAVAVVGSVAIAGVYMLIEVLTDQAIKIRVYNALGLQKGDITPDNFLRWKDGKIIRIFPHDLVRNFVPLTLWFWPALAALPAFMRGRWRMAAALLLSAVVLAASFRSSHDSSKLALFLSIVVAAVAWRSPIWGRRLVVTGWLCASLLVIPIVLGAHAIGMQGWRFVPDSGKTRLVIWKSTADEYFKAPILGIGANMTYVVGPQLNRARPEKGPERQARRFSIHPHNAFLQTFFELGIVGALILSVAGLAIIRRLAALPDGLATYGLATFTVVTTHAAVAYGMWQYWYVCVFASTAMILAFIERARRASV